VVVEAPAEDIEPEIEASIAPAEDAPDEPPEAPARSHGYWP
jgi:hypothetical protein